MNKVWEIIDNKEINKIRINAIKYLYENNAHRIKICRNYSKPSLDKNRCLLPALFKIYIDEALKGWNKKSKNGSRNGGRIIGRKTLKNKTERRKLAKGLG